MTLSLLDREAPITITDDPLPRFFLEVMRAGEYAPSFVLDETDRARQEPSRLMRLQIEEPEEDEYATSERIEALWTDEPKRPWRWFGWFRRYR
jgi:hypothetical protein